ncbi:MAG: 1-(5-phosphoribosyl)-5-[(5-phosphoribosylamino)methylideneamino]imidazole-4-carboxamide isomerase [Ferrimonas sp.]
MIIPAIDLINGQVVRLQQGDFQQVTQFDLDPSQQLHHYQQAGSQQLHLVDLDGAKDPQQRQFATIERIVSRLNTPIQVGGGIRTEAELTALYALGVNRVVIGSLAILQPNLVAAWVERYGPERITIALDVRLNAQGEPEVLTHGWQRGSGTPLESALAPLMSAGLRHVLCTDIERDGMLNGPNLALYQRLIQRHPQILWQASGGVHALTDIRALKQMGIGGIIIGKALLNGTFTIAEALTCWQNG